MTLDIYGLSTNSNRSISCDDLSNQHGLSITLLCQLAGVILLVSAISPSFGQVSTGPNHSNDRSLPPLENSPEKDRLMLREIGDQHIYVNDALHIASSGKRLQIVDRPSYPRQLLNPHKEALGLAQGVWSKVAASRRINVPDHPKIQYYLEQYRREAMWMSKIFHRATPFVGHIVEELDKRYIPLEMSLLPAIESGYQPDVFSTEEAAGIWQIVPLTAADIGVDMTTWFDGRADIIESTAAALDYISYLNAEFHGDWLLTLAAYNAGPGRVHNAIKRNQKQGKPVDFWSLRLPDETTNYVPKFLALVQLLRNPNVRSLEIPAIPTGNGFDIVEFRHRASIDMIASISGYHHRSLKRLNAGLIYGVTPPAGPHRVFVPLGVGDSLTRKMSSIDPSMIYSPPEVYQVVAGDTLSAIAARHNVSQQQLMATNNLETTTIFIGQELNIRGSKHSRGSAIEYIVTIGDTLYDIAAKHGVHVDDILNANDSLLRDDVIHPGQRLSIELFRAGTG